MCQPPLQRRRDPAFRAAHRTSGSCRFLAKAPSLLPLPALQLQRAVALLPDRRYILDALVVGSRQPRARPGKLLIHNQLSLQHTPWQQNSASSRHRACTISPPFRLLSQQPVSRKFTLTPSTSEHLLDATPFSHLLH